MATTKKKTAQAAPTFSLALKLNGVERTVTAPTLEELFVALPKEQAKTRAIFTISKGEKSTPPINYKIQQYNKLFYPGVTGQVQRQLLVKLCGFHL